MVKIVNELNPIITAFLLAAAMLAGWAASWWRGRSLREGAGESSSNQFKDAVMAMLGLLLAFTFSMSLAKHEQRRQMVVSDANAIGEFRNCANLLPEPTRGRLRSLIRQYVEHRLALANPSTTDELLQKSLVEIQSMHDQLELLVKDAVNAGTPIVEPLVTTLNALTSSHASRIAAAHDRLHPSILLLLGVTAVLCNSLMGHQQGATGESHPGAMLGFTLLVCMVIGITLDLNQSQRGWITVSQAPLEQLFESLD